LGAPPGQSARRPRAFRVLFAPAAFPASFACLRGAESPLRRRQAALTPADATPATTPDSSHRAGFQQRDDANGIDR